jgi:hypothetical protein
MKTGVNRKLFMGIGGFMISIPRMIAARGLQKGVSGATTKADLLSKEERRVHHFVVKKMATANEPITAELVGEELGLPVNRVEKTIDKLEGLKTFLYRSDGKRINWAYPHSLDNTGHKMTASTGERFFAAWAIDAFATPFVYGRLQNKDLTFTINSKCANSGKEIQIELDSELNIISMTEGSTPMYSMALINTDKMKEISIVDIFWRRSLFFWSEEDAREFQKKAGHLKFYMNINPVSLEGIKKIQSAIFSFDKEWIGA